MVQPARHILEKLQFCTCQHVLGSTDPSLGFHLTFDGFPRRAARKDHLGRPRGKATKETVGKGYLIGEAALYGEAYPFGDLTGGCWGVHGRGGFKHLV